MSSTGRQLDRQPDRPGEGSSSMDTRAITRKEKLWVAVKDQEEFLAGNG